MQTIRIYSRRGLVHTLKGIAGKIDETAAQEMYPEGNGYLWLR